MSGPATGIAIRHSEAVSRVEGPNLARRLCLALGTAFAAASGLLPHVLHHAGPLAGAALFAGAAGSILFGVLGFLAAIPFLLRLRRRSGGWLASGIALALFAVAFSISTFVIGPEISGADGDQETAAPAATEQPASSDGEKPADQSQDEGGGHAGHH